MPTPPAVRRRLRALRRLVLARRRPLAALLVALAVLVGLRTTVGPGSPDGAGARGRRATSSAGDAADARRTCRWRAGRRTWRPGGLAARRWPAGCWPRRCDEGEAITDVRFVGLELAGAHPGADGDAAPAARTRPSSSSCGWATGSTSAPSTPRPGESRSWPSTSWCWRSRRPAGRRLEPHRTADRRRGRRCRCRGRRRRRAQGLPHGGLHPLASWRPDRSMPPDGGHEENP